MTVAHDEATEPGVGATSLSRLRGLFGRALDVPPATRAVWLATQVPDSRERAALEHLLAADAHAGPFDTCAHSITASLAGVPARERAVIALAAALRIPL